MPASLGSFFQQLQQRTGPGFGAGPKGFARLMKRLGRPQGSFRIIHVAGTNGKGSVCHLCAEALQAQGWRTGRFISPHLFSAQERICVDGKPISRPAFVRLCQKVLAEQKEPLNFFEIITAAAFLYFSEQQVQYAVLETGLGGRKDPTNLCRPAVCIITSIGLDHCALLGGTLKQIAFEKAGIIKPGVPVFCPPLAAPAWAEIRRCASAAQAPLHQVKEGQPFQLQKIDWARGRLILRKGKTLWPLHILGEKQTQNACLVYQACRFLGVEESALKKAFARVNVPCRFDMVHKGPKRIIFDGAHNPQAVRVLIRFLQRSPWDKQAALVCGFMKDKDYPQMIKELAPHFAALYLTRPRGPRAVAPEQLEAVLLGAGRKENASGRGPNRADFAAENSAKSKTAYRVAAASKKRKNSAAGEVCCFACASRALRAACARYKTVVVSGSFYLAGYLRARRGLTENSDCD